MARWFTLLSGSEDPSTHTQALSSWLDLIHAVADAVIAASLFIIPAALVLLYLRRQERSGIDQLLILFILLLASAGVAHFASAIFGPGHGVVDVLTALSALFALTAAIVIIKLMPELLRRPSRDRLQAEISAHLKTLEELKDTRQQLEARVEERTKELEEAK
ncbi:MAG TPA: hypothetical protein VKD68_02375, partial [Methyloceanibacter sp.]|nr:hypothetical protein [Methyloceanibacter sp.]